MKLDHSQAQTANDMCKCRGCDAKMKVTVVPDLKVNKWTCRNCNLTQLWIPSKEYTSATLSDQALDTPNGRTTRFGAQKPLFCAGPFVGIGTDGCLTGVYDNPNNTVAIIASTVVIGLVAIGVGYYRENKASNKYLGLTTGKTAVGLEGYLR